MMKQPSLARAAAKKHVILFLAANPRDTGRLGLDAEARAIHLELKRSGFRDRFDFVTRWATEPLDLLRELRELQPTIVHFSGHAARTSPDIDVNEPGGLLVHNAKGDSLIVSPDALAQALDAVRAHVRLIVLNACYSASTAQALLAQVDCVVGMSGAIHDDAARSFAIGFYGSLGEQKSIATAFEQGKAAINLDGLLGATKPQLHVRDGFDPAQLVLAAVPPSVLLDVPCPHRGMRPLTVDDAVSFDRRDGEIEDLIDRLRAGEIDVTPSGSRKSSLVARGMLARLAQQLEDWFAPVSAGQRNAFWAAPRAEHRCAGLKLANWIRSHRADEQRHGKLVAAAVEWAQHGRTARGLPDPIELKDVEQRQQTGSAVQRRQNDDIVTLIIACRAALTKQRRRRRWLFGPRSRCPRRLA